MQNEQKLSLIITKYPVLPGALILMEFTNHLISTKDMKMLKNLISLPGRSPGRAIVLPPALTSVVAAAAALAKC